MAHDAPKPSPRVSGPLTLLAMFAAGVGCALLYTHIKNSDSPEGAAPKKLVVATAPAGSSHSVSHGAFPPPALTGDNPPADAAVEDQSEDQSSLSQEAAGTAPAEESDDNQSKVHELVSAATGDDPDARTEAIAALAEAPKADALPVLDRVLSVGTPEDRQLSLNSLRKLAQLQGDDDGEIRSTLQKAIYHGDSDEVTAGARQVISDIQKDAQAPQ